MSLYPTEKEEIKEEKKETNNFKNESFIRPKNKNKKIITNCVFVIYLYI